MLSTEPDREDALGDRAGANNTHEGKWGGGEVGRWGQDYFLSQTSEGCDQLLGEGLALGTL